MKILYESNVEFSDFLEICLTQSECDLFLEKGIVQDYRPGIYNDYNLNIFIRRMEPDEEEEENMPFKSKAQRAFLAINEPEVAHEFAQHTSKAQSAALPQRVKKAPAKKIRSKMKTKAGKR